MNVVEEGRREGGRSDRERFEEAFDGVTSDDKNMCMTSGGREGDRIIRECFEEALIVSRAMNKHVPERGRVCMNYIYALVCPGNPTPIARDIRILKKHKGERDTHAQNEKTAAPKQKSKSTPCSDPKRWGKDTTGVALRSMCCSSVSSSSSDRAILSHTEPFGAL